MCWRQTPRRPAAAPAPLPKRQLGKSGPQVTMLCMGGMMSALSPEYIDIAWSMGIRYFDTADCYLGGNSEKIFGAVARQISRAAQGNFPRLQGPSAPRAATNAGND